MQRVESRSGAPQLVPKAKCQVFGKVQFLDCEQLFIKCLCGHYYNANTDHFLSNLII